MTWKLKLLKYVTNNKKLQHQSTNHKCFIEQFVNQIIFNALSNTVNAFWIALRWYDIAKMKQFVLFYWNTVIELSSFTENVIFCCHWYLFISSGNLLKDMIEICWNEIIHFGWEIFSLPFTFIFSDFSPTIHFFIYVKNSFSKVWGNINYLNLKKHLPGH